MALSDLNLLKLYNEDLNILAIFAMAHDEVEKLSGQLFLYIASRLPRALKQQYLDYLEKKGLDLNSRFEISWEIKLKLKCQIVRKHFSSLRVKKDKCRVRRTIKSGKVLLAQGLLKFGPLLTPLIPLLPTKRKRMPMKIPQIISD